MFKKLNTLDSLIFFIFLFALLPFLFLCLYNEPSLDDYSYAASALKKSFCQNQIYNYLHWGSRYTATGILIINPIIYNWLGGYKLISFFMIILFILAGYYMFSVITKSTKLSLVLTSFLGFIYLFLLPDVTSAFYWLPGSATYHFANILSLLFITFIFKLNSPNNILYKFLLFLLTFLIIGCNEISMIYLDILIFILFVYSYYTQKKIPYFYLTLLFWTGILTLFILLSPGNSARSGISNNVHQLNTSIQGTVRKSIVIFFRYGIITFIINLLLFYNIRKDLLKLNLPCFNFPFIFYMVSFISFLFIGSFPSLWAIGLYPPLRTINVIFFATILFSMIFSYKIVTLNFIEKLYIPTIVLCLALLGIIITYVFTLQNKYFFNFTNNLYFAYRDIITHEASNYQREINNRYLEIKTSNKDTLYLSPLKYRPKTIFESDLREDPAHFYNLDMAKFFNKKAIYLK